MKLNPAQYVVSTFGGIRPTARAIGRVPSAVHRWTTTGNIPHEAGLKILKIAKRKKLNINATDLVLGRTISKKKKK